METTSSQHRRGALRAIYEQWGVSVALLATVSRLAQSTINSWIEKEGWQTHPGPLPLHAELMAAYRRHLVAVEEDTEICPEKRARALAVLAKTLESITAMSVRLSAVQNKSAGGAPSNASSADNGSPENLSEADHRAQLDAQLARLLGGAGQAQ